MQQHYKILFSVQFFFLKKKQMLSSLEIGEANLRFPFRLHIITHLLEFGCGPVLMRREWLEYEGRLLIC